MVAAEENAGAPNECEEEDCGTGQQPDSRHHAFFSGLFVAP